MRQIWILAFILIVLLVLATVLPAKADDDVLVVTGVEISESAVLAAKAEQQAALPFSLSESGRLDFADDIALTSAPESAVTAQARGQAAITNGQVRAGISNEYLSETHVALGDKNAARIYTATTANDSFNGAISPKDLIAVIRSHLGAVRGAYERQLKYDPNLSGRFRVEITVASDGRVGNVRVLEDTIGSKELAASLLRNIENWRFPSPSGGTPFTFSYPFNFVQSL